MPTERINRSFFFLYVLCAMEGNDKVKVAALTVAHECIKVQARVPICVHEVETYIPVGLFYSFLTCTFSNKTFANIFLQSIHLL